MIHNIKTRRAQKIAPKLPMVTDEIWGSIPPEMIAIMSSKQLAAVVNALDNHWHKAVRKTEQNIVGDGYVWSAQHNKLLDITGY